MENLIMTDMLTSTLFGISVLVIFAVELAYLLRVVFVPRARTGREAAEQPDPARPTGAGQVDVESMRRPRL